MSGAGRRSKYWCFTLNNYTDADIERLSAPLTDVDYIIFGREIGEQGTPHLQGTVCFRSRKRLNQCIAILGQAHFSPCRSLSNSIEYCKKEGDFIEIGEPPSEGSSAPNNGGSSNGKENVDELALKDLMSAVKSGVKSAKDLREGHPLACAKFPGFVRSYLEDHREKIEVRLNCFVISTTFCLPANTLFVFTGRGLPPT